MKKVLTLLIVAAWGSCIMAQQDAQYSFYMFNNLYFNPAYAGKKEALNFEALHRQQWQFFGIGKEIDGAPMSTSFSVHAPFKRNQNALGFTFHNDIIGFFNNSSLSLSYAYRIPLGENYKMSIGVKGTYDLFHVKTDEINPVYGQPDAAVNQLLANPNIHKFNAGAGVYFWHKNDRFYAGFSVPRMIQNRLYTEQDSVSNITNSAQQHIHYFATTGFVIGKQEGNFKFYPSTLMKFVKNAPIDFDVNANFLLYDRLWLGAGYRFGGNIFTEKADNSIVGEGSTLIGMIRALVTNTLEIGYAYDHTLPGSDLNRYNSGSHEFLLNFRFDKKMQGPEGVRITTPRYINYF